MVKIIVVLGFLALAAGAGFWYVSNRDNGSAKIAAEADAQAAAIVGSLYANVAPASTQTGAAQPAEAPTIITNSTTQKIMHATMHTNKGDITIEFLDKQAPNTVANFVKLAKSGFYDGTKFHRVIKGFMIQGGDPLTKDDAQAARWGTGGPGYQFADEISAANHNDVGTIAMANSGPNTNGSQFFINVANNNFLDDKHTVFGKVVSGMDVVTAIENTATGAADRPVEPMVIERVTVAP